MSMELYVLIGLVGGTVLIAVLLADKRKNRTRASATLQTGAHEARTKRNRAEAEEEESEHILDNMQKRLSETRQLEELDYENKKIVYAEASIMRVPPDTYGAIRQKEEFERIAFEIKRAEFIEAARRVNIEKNMPELVRLDELTKLLKRMCQEKDLVNIDKELSEESKKRMIEDLDTDITAIEEAKREIRGRLVSSAKQQRTLGSDSEDADI